MADTLTDEQLDTAMRYLAKKMIEERIDVRNPHEVVKFMLLNPLPDHMEVIAELNMKDETEKVRRIALLHKELATRED